MTILIPIVVLSGLGVIFGVGLAIASKRFAVQMDARLEKIHGLLPGSNCGACGGAGCFGFAEDILSGKRSIDACRVSAFEIKERIAGLIGQKIEKKVKRVATLHCHGGTRVQDRFLYKGIRECKAAALVLGGEKACVFGCLGYGTCVAVCPFDALSMSGEGLPVVDDAKCRACNKCVAACPKKLYTLVPIHSTVHVACRSHDTGKETRAVCPVGCIACLKCEKACAFDAIHVVDNLAVIDYAKCTSCGACVAVCPMKTIHMKAAREPVTRGEVAR